ncbi:site-specific integrase [Bradyrhizobium sp. WYCCWR 13023]|uniref:Site-specific integrase n=1 Tax=Bradyrhizobium zhengyangense TaxID=2911009 RepID=A0A9X1RAB7_9BRAD|nr:site-specific integrase [Bradyrhizobium zhengyangense]MCG2628301.1 site-specific integrase [Bradyrhizobium zhengyangense]
MKLTQTRLAGLKLEQGETDKIFFDDQIPSFGLRLREGGSRKFVLHYRIGGRQRRLTIGTPSTALTLEVARQRANKALLDLGEGKDPAVEKAMLKEGAKITFKSVAVDYLGVLEKRVEAGELKPRAYEQIETHLTKHFKPLDRLVLGSINRATIATRLREIGKERGLVAADRARSNLSTFFGWAIGEGICETNPVDGTNRQSGEYVERARSLIQMHGEKPNYDELIAVWKGAPENEYGKIVRLLILTLCRRDEIGSLERAEIDKENRLIRLSGERTKNGREHIVPLSDPAMAILETIDEKKDRELVFGWGKGGYSGWSKSKAELEEAVPSKKPWTLHDLRRTGRTGLGILGVAPHVAEAVLNHLPPKLTRTYDKNKYEKEKREALDLWAAHLMRLVSGEQSNVVPLRA